MINTLNVIKPIKLANFYLNIKAIAILAFDISEMESPLHSLM